MPAPLPHPWGTRQLGLLQYGSSPASKRWLVVHQVHRHLMGEAAPPSRGKVSLTTFRGALPSMDTVTERLPITVLRAVGAVGASAPAVCLAKVAHVATALEQLGFEPQVVGCIKALETAAPPPPPPAYVPPPPPAPAAAAAPPAQAAYSPYQPAALHADALALAASEALVSIAASAPQPQLSVAVQPAALAPPPAASPALHPHQPAATHDCCSAPPRPPPPPPAPAAAPRPAARAAPPPPAPPIPVAAPIFPSTVAVPTLTAQQQREPYGLPRSGGVPPALAAELSAFKHWCSAPIRLDRDLRFRAVQSHTLESTADAIMSYMGYARKFVLVPIEQLSLTLYRDPSALAAFFAYVTARGVGRQWLSTHAGVARKVVSYLQSQSPWPHTATLDTFITTLQRQLAATIPAALRLRELPEAEDVYAWVDGLVAKCMQWSADDAEHLGCLSMATARLVHDTVLAMLVTGSHVPPPRLHTLKSMMHPAYAGTLMCQDPDCLYRGRVGCLGNRIEVGLAPRSAAAEAAAAAAAGGSAPAAPPPPSLRVQYVAPHHKNDRKALGPGRPISYTFPPGPLSELVALHVQEGHAALRKGRTQPLLFTDRAGKAFDDCTFSIWWAELLRGPHGPAGKFAAFPPSKGRNLFIGYYMAIHGTTPDDWEGAAACMGNSVRMWREVYAPQVRRAQAARNAQRSVDRYASVRAAAAQLGGEAGPSSAAPAAAAQSEQPPAAAAVDEEGDEKEEGAWADSGDSSTEDGGDEAARGWSSGEGGHGVGGITIVISSGGSSDGGPADDGDEEEEDAGAYGDSGGAGGAELGWGAAPVV